MMQSPASTYYSPNLAADSTKHKVGKGVISATASKYDEYAFKRLVKRSPSPGEYEIKDAREYGHTERFRAPVIVRLTHTLS